MRIDIIKIGGNVVENEELLQKFAMDFAAMEGPKILVHGGGVMASRIQKSLGIEPVMIAGRRVTDGKTLEIVTMVYAGWCSRHIVATLQKYGCDSIGMCGADGNVIRASRRPPVRITLPGETEPMTVDFGYAGDVCPDGINAGLLLSLAKSGTVPVLCAITHDGNGNLLNTNADTIASSVAESLASAEGTEVHLTYCFEKNGVLMDKDDPESVISQIDRDRYEELKAAGIVADGMIPKLDNAFKAIGNGVASVTIKHVSDLNRATGTTLRK